MRIALVSPSPLPALKYGGTERVTMWLHKGLTESHIDVILISPPLKGASLPHLIWPETSFEWKQLQKSKNIDLFHFMCLIPPSFPKEDLPHLSTIHGNAKNGEIFPLNTVFVSRNHALRHHAEAFVYNGIDLQDYPLHSNKKKSPFRALFLGKASWKVKNLKGSIRITQKARWKLDVAGGTRPFTPLGLSAWNTKFHGMIDDSYKQKLFQETSALIFPVLWHEPFGVAVVEALASGLPAIVTPYGALPEIVNNECGLVSLSESEMVMFLQEQIQNISSEACREKVRSFFTYQHMTKKYISYYESVLKGTNINSSAPYYVERNEEFLLDQKNNF